MFIINFILKLLGWYISPEDEATVKEALSTFWSATKMDKTDYISYSMRDLINAAISKPIENLSTIYVPKRKAYYDEVQQALENAEKLDCLIDAANEEYIKNELDRSNHLLSNIDGKSLDRQQRNVVVSGEDYTLVLAGAGSGKTLTIAGKVKYLCDMKGIEPNKILLISFTTKAAQELTERINKKLGIDVKACTFHKLGLDIISSVNNVKPEVIDKLDDFVKDYFLNSLPQHPERTVDLIRFFSFFLTMPIDLTQYSNIGDAYAAQKTAEFESLKSRYNQRRWIHQQAQSQMKHRTSLKHELMKSIEEVMLANFLFLNGVEYEYEKKYPYSEPSPNYGVYHPDFYLPQYDIYIEHFGITEDCRVPWLDAQNEKKYLDGIKWKRHIHSRHHTKLLETYSFMVSKGTFLNELDRMLRANGVRYNPPSFENIYKTCYVDKEDYQLKEFIKLCCSFITLFKSKGYSSNDLDTVFSAKTKRILSMPWLYEDYIRARETLFKRIIAPILREYERYLNGQDAIDFSDMINIATKLVPIDKDIDDYKYIIIDEYQDISKARFNLIKAIIDKTGAKLLCVGDDWQSIYRFAGSDVALFTDFEKYLGRSLILKIEQTYRNSQQLIDVAESFVMKNPRQLKKKLSSSKSMDVPIRFFCYTGNPANEIKAIMDSIIQDGDKKTVMFLGRTSYDEQLLTESGLFSTIGNDTLRYNESPQTPVRFLTVHKSKGLEADNVVILNFKNALLGFPNKISDDPILEKVLDEPDEFRFAEERRLLYVALTRTRNRGYLLVEQTRPSEFLQEFEKLRSVKIYDRINTGEKAKRCPICKTGVLVVRHNAKTGSPFIGCSNYPQCQYSSPILDDAPSVICPKCGAPMVKRKGRYGEFYGCTNFPNCRQTRNI